MLLRLAMRNVFRARARSAITIGALFFGVVMSLLLSALVMGVGESLVAEAIESRVGAIQVHKKGYFEKRDRQPLVFHIDRDPALEQKLLGVPNVTGLTPRIQRGFPCCHRTFPSAAGSAVRTSWANEGRFAAVAEASFIRTYNPRLARVRAT